MLEVNKFNNGDKFLLTMTNLERTELFLSKGLKGMTPFKKLDESISNAGNNPKLLFDSLGLDFPRNIDIERFYGIDTRFSCVRIDFMLSYAINTNKKIKFDYSIIFTPSNRKGEKTHCVFKTDKITLNEIPNKLSTRSPFTYNFKLNNEKSLLENLIDLQTYYDTYDKHFVDIVNAFNNNDLDDCLNVWGLKTKLWPFHCCIAILPSEYLNFVKYGINYETFIGIESFIHTNRKENQPIIDKALELMQSNAINDGMELINKCLNSIKSSDSLNANQKLNLLLKLKNS